MTSTSNTEGTEDVNDFLLRIRELGEKRDKEDEERTKKLEEEILKGRRERQARRAERARSISPTKDSPLSDPARFSMPPATSSQRVIDPPEQLEPTCYAPERETTPKSYYLRDDESVTTAGSRRGSRVEGNEIDTSPRTSPLRSRAGTLSWQQRPTSRDLGSSRSFFSGSSARENRWRAMSTTSNDEPVTPQSPSARSPSAKETPSLNRAERNLPSPTCMKTTEDGLHETSLDLNTEEPRPDKESNTEPEKETNLQDIPESRSRSPSRASSIFADSTVSHRYSSVSSMSTATGLGSPVPLSSAQKLEPPKVEQSPEDQTTSPILPRRLSPERSTSPTKGLGGFVQSAMMKRSDSVSKRWSAQLPSGLARGNTIAGSRNSFAAFSSRDCFSTMSASRLSREGPLLPTHRPSSSHSEATVVHNTKDNERQVMPSGPSSNFNTLSDESPSRLPLALNSNSSITLDSERPATPPLSGGSNTTRPIESPGRPPLSVHARSTISVGNDVGSETGSQLPTSPAVSRTIDPKRWSPTKSTWLESALNRPESPRHKKQPSQQLSWTRDRQSKGSVDLGRKNSFKEVTPVGLMRTTAPGGHSKSSSVSGIPDIFTSQDSNESKDEPENNKASETQDSNASAGDKTSSTSTDVGVELQSTEDDSTKRSQAPPSLLLTQKRVDSPLSSPHVPLLNRPKPKSPVIDFRANLRRREVVKDESRKEEPEFKNIFGKLKKTETSNYVAPDKLKENILRGKASLSTTGGPKKSQRVDELKESILKQKEAMKAGGGSLRRNTAGELDAPPTAVPEAIAKRKNLTKSSSVNNDLSLDTPTSPSPEESETPQISQDTQPSPLPFQEQMDWDRYPVTQVATAEEPKPDTNYTQTETAEPGPFNSEKNDQSAGDRVENKIDKSILDKNQEISGEKAIKPVRALPSDTVAEAINTPAANEDPSAKGKLAGRINPALAGLLSRGPPVAVNGSGKTLPTNASKENGTDLSKHTAPLTHATKNRARGPKRRLPKATTTKAPESNPEDNIKPQEESPQPSISSKGPEASSSSYSSGWPLPDGDIATPISSEKGLTQLSPSTMNKPTEFKRTIPSTCERDIKTKSEGHDSDTSPRLNKCIPYLQKTPVENLDSLEGSPSSRPTPPSKSTAPSTPIVGQARGSQIQYSSPSPSPLRTSFKENQIYPPPSPYRKTTSGIGFPWSKDSSPRDKALPSPPVPPKNNQPADQLSSPRSSASLVPQAGESLEAISAFFKTFPSSSNRVDIDPQLMLESKPDNQKIRTLKKQMWEITGDGKRQDLPVHQEYILYEGSMYLCVHLFEADGSIRSETYLWCGDDVSDSAIDDAQAFSRKVARENGCKLEIIKQGKETSRFIQALGGILITRRGSSSRSSSSAIFMLCGRKHLGQMVFDEVDFSRRNLCTGYPFVISAMFGKLYLWKGKGSTAEEIGAARLIGMDLGLTGEFEEVGEGEEPESFFEVFPPYAETGDYMDAHYWRLKPNHDHFRLRLLRVDHELGQRSGFWLRRSGSSSPVIRPNDTVQEVEPFRQKDITGKGIFVLDVFFEIYVIVGEQASNRPAEFASAVVFAHEYGILAASLQDRPFIPKSYVSVGGLPDSCRSAFRKWEPRLPSTPPPRVFPLNAAIEAIRT